MRLSMLDMRLVDAFGYPVRFSICVCVGLMRLEDALEICVWTFVIVRSILCNVQPNRRFSHKTTPSHCIQRFYQFLLDFPCQI